MIKSEVIKIIYSKKNKELKGLLTVEAALVLPIFIYAILAIIYFLQILWLQENLQNGITETGYFAAKYAYVYDYIQGYEGKDGANSLEEKSTRNQDDESNVTKDYIDNKKESLDEKRAKAENLSERRAKAGNSAEGIIAKAIDSSFYKIKLKDYVDVNRINQFCIKGGYSGIQTYLSSFMVEEDAVDIILVYKVKLPLLFIVVDDIPMVQRVRLRGWSGTKVALKSETEDDTETSEEMVYITEHGTVYHLSKECSHLTLSIKEASMDTIKNLRNDSGGKYKECEICDKYKIELENNKVYITDYGDRYHKSLSCSGLKRTIKAIPKSEVGDRSLCKRCGK